jgi:enoyl-CoA hydratase/carnithine racemase
VTDVAPAGRLFAVRRDGPVTTITIKRPSKRNAISLAMWRAIPRLIRDAEAAEATRVLVLRGEPAGDFSVGGDISEFRSNRSDTVSEQAYAGAVREAADALATAAVPTIAGIEGYCLGGGCLLAVACDLRVAAETAHIGITPARLGIVYSFHATRQLVDLVGPGWARYMLLTGSHLTASTSARIGLIHEVFPAADFEHGLGSLARQVASLAPISQRAARDYIRAAAAGPETADTLEERYGDSSLSGDYTEGVSAFLDRREPDFGS